MGLLSWVSSVFRSDPLAAEPVTYRPVGIVRNRVRAPQPCGWEDQRSDIVLREDLTSALDELDGFSHVIVVFHMGRVPEGAARLLTTRIGGDASSTEVGVFATRVPSRPNPIGVSVVRVVRRRKNVLRVRGLDALDRTPVLDLKPYLPPYDAVPDALLPAWARREDDQG